jgi:AI-2 transport protein TqsA
MNSPQAEATPGVRALTLIAYFMIVVAGLRIAAPLLIPIAVATFIAIVSLPALMAFTRAGVPRPLAILLVVLLDALVLGVIGWIVFESASEVGAVLPAYLIRFQELEASLLATLQRWGVDIAMIPYPDLYQPERLFDLATRVLRGVTGAVSTAFLVLLLLVFMLSEAAILPGKIRRVLGGHAGDVAHYARIVGEVQRYLALKTAISLTTGLVIGVSAWMLGVDFALLWGLLAFLLNFIPSIGSILAAIPALSIALLQLGLGHTVALAAVYLAVNVALGNFLEPTLMGRRLGLSTLVVVLSLLFWGWVWGIVGMLLSLPLTMAVKIVLENTRDLRWVATLMGPAILEQKVDEVVPGPVPRAEDSRSAHSLPPTEA